MTMHNKIEEGLSENALDYLVQPLLSIDEYCSKISDKRAIVIGFFINDEDPANDLSNFIDRSSLPILDTEVSPAPTPEGYYMTFVEVQRDEEFPKTLIEMLKEVKNLTNVKDWTFQCPKHDEVLELDLKNLKKYLVLDQSLIVEPEDDQDSESEDNKNLIEDREFWKNATLDAIKLQKDVITFLKNNYETSYRILDESPKGGIGLGFESDTRDLQNLLGPAYNVWSMNNKLVVEHMDECVVLKSI